MSTWKLRSIPALCAFFALATSPAGADVKIVSKMTLDSPMMNNLPAQLKAQMSNMQITTYVSGKKIFVNTPMYLVLIDQDAKTQTMINPIAKTYYAMPYNPTMAQSIMSGPMGGIMGGMQGIHSEENKTGETTFLGHKVRDFVTTGHMSMQGMGDMSLHAETLYAQDLPTADAAAYNAMSAGMPGNTDVTGIPVKVVSTVTGGPLGTTTMTMEATSITTDPIPASVFAIPSGYTKQDSPTMPGMGGMTGGAPPAPTQ